MSERNALDNFIEAANCLCEKWDDLGLSDYGVDRYPFDSSFDEVLAEIVLWRELYEEERKVMKTCRRLESKQDG